MFEKYYDYFDIKNKMIEIKISGGAPYFTNLFRGKCVGNPKVIPYNLYDSLIHSLAVQVDEIPKLISSSYYIKPNYIEPFYGHIIYIPFRVVNTIYVIQPDNESKLMLLWVSKHKKNIPIEIINNILKFMNGWERKISIIGFS